MIRRAKPGDVAALETLATQVLRRFDLGDLVISPERIRYHAISLVSDPASLVLVDERLTGAIAVAVSDGFCFERKAAQVCFWYAASVWTLRALLREALAWCDSRPAIKAVGFSFDFAVDERLGHMLDRAGLQRRGFVYARY